MSTFELQRLKLLRKRTEWFEVLSYILKNPTTNTIGYLRELGENVSTYDNESYLISADKILLEDIIFTDNRYDENLGNPLENAERRAIDISKSCTDIVIIKIRHAAYTTTITTPDLATTKTKIYKIFCKGEVLVDLSGTRDVRKELAYNDLWRHLYTNTMISLFETDKVHKGNVDEKERSKKLTNILQRKERMVAVYVDEYRNAIEKIDKE